jgi:hypothetical protein
MFNCKVVFLEVEDPTDLTAVQMGLGVDPDEGLVVGADVEAAANKIRTPMSQEIVEGHQLMFVGMVTSLWAFPFARPIQDGVVTIGMSLPNPSATCKG